MSAAVGLMPNFFVIGAAKAGTSTLYDLLKQHPQVYLPFAKEPMFFSNDRQYARGLPWYVRTYFGGAGGLPARGEATPHYLYWSEKVALRMRVAFPAQPVKFIVILRDPVWRAYSWYWNMIREGRESRSFEEALESEATRLEAHAVELEEAGLMTYGYFRGGCYAALLEPFLQRFPREHFLFILQDDLERDFRATLRRLMRFLEVRDDLELQPTQANPAAMPRSRLLHSWLVRQDLVRERLKAVIPLRLRYMVKTYLTRANMRTVAYPPLDPQTEKELRLRFADQVIAVSKIIDRDLGAWLPR